MLVMSRRSHAAALFIKVPEVDLANTSRKANDAFQTFDFLIC